MLKRKLRALVGALSTIAFAISAFSLTAFAESTGTSTSGGTGGTGWMSILMLGLVVVFFYFFLIRPQKKQEKEANQMRNSLEIGDEIVTIGGIVGQVISIKNETITIVTSKDRTKIRFVKSAIREVTVKANEPVEKTASKEEDAPALKEDKKAKTETENESAEQ